MLFRSDDINKLTYDCESIISCDTIPSVAYSQGVIPNEILDTDELTEIVDKTLSKSEQKEIIQKSNVEPSLSNIDLENVVSVKNEDRIQILDITGKESIFDDDSDIELETDVDCSDYTIFPPKDPQCSTSGIGRASCRERVLRLV